MRAPPPLPPAELPARCHHGPGPAYPPPYPLQNYLHAVTTVLDLPNRVNEIRILQSTDYYSIMNDVGYQVRGGVGHLVRGDVGHQVQDACACQHLRATLGPAASSAATAAPEPLSLLRLLLNLCPCCGCS